MQRILCYGDSNTWGYDPVHHTRYPKAARWPGVLAQTLGDGYEIIEEGLGGRTTVWDDPIEGYKNGYTYLIPCLESHRPLDLVIILLGTNDLKTRFHVSAYDIAESAGVLARVVQASRAGPDDRPPAALLIAPPPLAKLTDLAERFDGAAPKSLRLGQHYRRVAGERGCAFLDAGAVICSSDLDGIHLEASEQFKLGQAAAVKVKEILGE